MNYHHTIKASYMGYVTQGIVNNFVPLLFVTFKNQFGVSIEQITLLIVINFGVQLLIDWLSAKFVDKIGYRVSIVAAHIFAATGLFFLGTLPYLLGYSGLVISVVFYAIGGGLIEVLVSPLVEACPTDEKSSEMSLLHSFYCWGVVGTILISTAFFALFGTQNWNILSIIWAIIPAANAVFFAKVPIYNVNDNGERTPIRSLVKTRIFWAFVVLMVCAGAAELAMSQWSSAFAETGLNVSKTIGDIAGPCMFAVTMGLGRVLYAKLSSRINLNAFMTLSCILCIISYIIACFSPSPIMSLAACELCGFSVAIMWPGTYSLAADKSGGGTTMFALLALAGDAGCILGPSIVGLISSGSDDLRLGFGISAVFPFILLFILATVSRARKEK